MKHLQFIFFLFMIISCTPEKSTQPENSTKKTARSIDDQHQHSHLKSLVVLTPNPSAAIQMDQTGEQLLYTITLNNSTIDEYIEHYLAVAEGVPVDKVTAKVKVEVDFLQYTIDNNPAAALSFNKILEGKELSIIDRKLEWPGVNSAAFTNLIQHKQVTLSSWLNEEELKELAQKSKIYQQKVYKGVLDEEEKYSNCCPEYIAQAKAFFETVEADSDYYKKLDNAGLEMIYSKMMIELTEHKFEEKAAKNCIVFIP